MFCWHTTALIITLSVVLIASVIISDLLWIEASVKSDVHEPPSIPAGPSPALEPEKIRKHRSGLHLQRNTEITSSSSITRRFLRRSQPEPERERSRIIRHQCRTTAMRDVTITSERTSDLCSGATNTHTWRTEQKEVTSHTVTSGDVQIEETHPHSAHSSDEDQSLYG